MKVMCLPRHAGFLLAMAALFARSAAAQPVSGPYVSAGGGADFLQNQILPANPGAAEPKHVLHFDQPGAAGDLSVGWGFGNGLRVELEGDYLNDHVEKTNFPSIYPRRAGGYEQTYGGFANVLYDIPLRLPVHPYVGVGAGGQVLEADDFNQSPAGVPVGRGGAARLGSFAYQAIAGLAVPVPWVRGLALTADYRFMGLPDELPAYRISSFEAVQTGAIDGRPVYRDRIIGIGNQHIENIFHHTVTIGVRYAFETAPPPRPPVPMPGEPPVPVPARTYLVFFDWDQAALTPRARQIVREAATNSTHVQTTTVEVDGYADTSHALRGARGQAYNLRLSLRRADAVRSELVRDGVPGGVIAVHGYGDTHLLVPTGSDTREPQNRRVEIVLR